nr:ATPase, T2SS/T4P/T4SS family [Halochromatium roseum]
MLVRLGLVSERDMAAASAEVLGLALITAEQYPDEPVAEEHLSLRFLKDAGIMPLSETEQEITLAVADPLDDFIPKAVNMATCKHVNLQVGLPTEIQAALERVYEQPADDEAEAEIQAELGNFSEEDIEHLRDLASEAPVIRLVNQILQRAVEMRASDVHIEPFADQLKVRYRVDGILKEGDSPPVSSTAAVISRIKIMAKLNIAERRLPQDGRIPQRIQGKELDLRVSTVPTMFGESVVMRLLDKESVSFDFDALGFDGPPRDRLLQVLDQPYGIFLVTGPTGSGKSTTLYTALSRLNTEQNKILTVEDPVEYQVAGINQIPVKSSIGMTFAGALRAIVRQDPDIIMVGEMRDLETARIAVQSALTGHVVLSTLHTNDAASGVTRLLDMGVEDYLLTSTINGILAQRLVRRLCPECRQPYTPAPDLAAKMLEGDRGPASTRLSASAMAGSNMPVNAAAGINAWTDAGTHTDTNAGIDSDAVGKASKRHAGLRSWFSWRRSPAHRERTDAQSQGAGNTAPANLKPSGMQLDGFKPTRSNKDQPFQLYRAVGCKACNHSGYRGRLVIAEVLLMSDRIRQAVLGHATAGDIHRIAVEEGMATMYRDGLRKALDGRTTIEEVIRVAEDK